MQFFGLLIPIVIGYFLDEMATGVIIGSLFWLVAWSIAKQRQEERLAESATAGDRMQKLEQEIELLKQRLSVLEHEAVRDEAKVGQGLEALPVADVQTASEPLHVRVEAEAAPVKQKIEEAFAPSFSIPIDPVSAKAAASSEPVVESEVIEAVAPVAAEQEELPKEDAVVASMPSENERQTVRMSRPYLAARTLPKPCTPSRSVSVSGVSASMSARLSSERTACRAHFSAVACSYRQASSF